MLRISRDEAERAGAGRPTGYLRTFDRLKGVSVFPFFNPRAADLVLGLVIGLSLSLAWHWVYWTIY